MSPNLNNFAAEINTFLQVFEQGRSTRSHIDGGHVPATGYTPVLLEHEMRYARSLSLTNSTLAVHHPCTERAPSLATSATDQEGVFDGERRSAYSESTAPPSRGPEARHRQRPLVPMPNVAEHPPVLPCEFIEFSRCEERFGINQVEMWIQHIIDAHLQHNLPSYSVCWFCDEGKFAATTNTAEGRERCYRARMHHNAEHFRRGLREDKVRPDFHFLEHLHRHRLINESAFQAAKCKTERPQFPGIIINSTPSASRAPCDVFIENRRNRRPRAPPRPPRL